MNLIEEYENLDGKKEEIINNALNNSILSQDERLISNCLKLTNEFT